MSIEKHLSTLLSDQDCVILPGFGGFIANYIPAVINPVTHVFTPPSRQIVFNARLQNNDGILANHLVRTMNISYSEAVQMIAAQSSEWLTMINKGNKINLEGIGLLYADNENNLQFQPVAGANFLQDAFGLSGFTSQPVIRPGLLEKTETAGRQTTATYRRRIPSSFKWAAVVLPFAALSFWGAFNTDRVNHMYENVASFFPSVSSNSAGVNDKTAHYRSIPAKATESPEVVSYISEEKAIQPTETTVEETVENIAVVKNSFFIIAGAFSIEENALNMVEMLKSKGFKAEMAGRNANGLYRVSMEAHSDKIIALERTEALRQDGFPGAWLLTIR